MSEPPTQSRTPNHGEVLPWPLIGAALAAMAALYITGNQFILVPVLGVIIVASRFSVWRLPRGRVVSWGLRGVIVAVLITVINQQSNQDTTVWYLKQQDTNLAGYALVAELALRAWERREPATGREWLGVALLLTALIFAAATDTYSRLPVQIITPIYCVLVVLSLRSIARVGQPTGVSATICRELAVLRGTALLVALGVSSTGIYLVTHYEYQVTAWAVKVFKKQRKSRNDLGFSIRPRLTTVFNPEPSPDRVLLIDGQPTEQHLRVMAFDTYAKQLWLPAIGDRSFGPAVLNASAGQLAGRNLHFTLMGDTADLLPVPLEAARIAADEPLKEDELGTLTDTQSGSNLSYNIMVAKAPVFQGPLCVPPNEKERMRLLAIPPEIDAKVSELAKTVAGTGEPGRQLFRIQAQLRSHHAYSLSFEPQGEPLTDFILNDRAAHCQYFASAMVVMARAVGIPARYVGGFYAHEMYGSDQMVVRQRDAHAWAECWIDGTGWVIVDATPAGGLPDAIFKDPSSWKRWWEKLTDIPGQVRDWLTGRSAGIKLAIAIGAIVVLFIWIARAILAHRRRPQDSGFGYPMPGAELVELGRRFEAWLRSRDLACPPQRTWRQHLSDTVIAETPRMFVDLYDLARFGDYDGRAVARARELLKEMESEQLATVRSTADPIAEEQRGAVPHR